MKTKRERERGETMISDLKFRITDLKNKCCLGRNLNIEISNREEIIANKNCNLSGYLAVLINDSIDFFKVVTRLRVGSNIVILIIRLP